MTAPDQLAVLSAADSETKRTAATRLAQRGWFVLASLRQLADVRAVAGPGVEPIALKVTDAVAVEALVGRLDDDPARRSLSVLIDNAGVSVDAPLETLALDALRRHVDVHFLGHLAVTEALLPALLAARRRVVDRLSMSGWLGRPADGSLAASMLAPEAFSDVLRRELYRFGLTVFVIEADTVAHPQWSTLLTAMRERSTDWTVDTHQRRDPLVAAMPAQAGAILNGAQGLTPDEVARRTVAAITSHSPRRRYLIGDDACSPAGLAAHPCGHGVDPKLTAALAGPDGG